MPTALLTGAFGQHDLADDAVLEAFVAGLAGWRLFATTLDEDAIMAKGCEPVSTRDPRALARAAASSDAVVVAGAHALADLAGGRWRRLEHLLAALALVAEHAITRRRVAMVGVGGLDVGGPLGSVVQRALVRHTDLLVLRDAQGAARLVASGVPGPLRVGADPVWSLIEPRDVSVNRGARASRRVVVVPAPLAPGAERSGGLLARLATALEVLHSSGFEIVLQPWRSAPARTRARLGDLEIVHQLQERLGRAVSVLSCPGSLGQAIESMGDASLVLTLRFHALVAAGAAGLPAVAIALDPDLVGLGRRLSQPVLSFEADPSLIAETVVRTGSTAGPSVATIKEEIARAEEEFRLLRVVLRNGEGDGAAALGSLPLEAWPR